MCFCYRLVVLSRSLKPDQFLPVLRLLHIKLRISCLFCKEIPSRFLPIQGHQLQVHGAAHIQSFYPEAFSILGGIRIYFHILRTIEKGKPEPACKAHFPFQLRVLKRDQILGQDIAVAVVITAVEKLSAFWEPFRFRDNRRKRHFFQPPGLLVRLFPQRHPLLALDHHHVPVPPIHEDYDPNAKTDAIIEAVVGDTTENYLISPLSLKAAFALAANGAEGETQQEILGSLGMGNLGQFNDYMKDRKEKYGKAADVITIDLNNSIWVNESRAFGADFREDYKLLLDDFYSAEAGKVNDSNAVSTINGWISDKTRGEIDKVLNSPEFTTCLVNTLYFKGAWMMPFNKQATRKGTFTNADGTQTQTDLMHMTEDIRYYSRDGVQMIRLPYENLVRDENGMRKGDGPFVTASMYVVLSDQPVELANLIDEARDEMSMKLVAVTLPKFTFKWNGELNTALQELGIRKAFTDAAEFDPMSELPQCISQVLQSTFIAVDEEGTEAAAATVILEKATTALDPKVPIPFTADHPFRFAIVDDDSHEVLFAGAYNEVK